MGKKSDKAHKFLGWAFFFILCFILFWPLGDATIKSSEYECAVCHQSRTSE